MEFHWEQRGNEWHLLPAAGETRIVVKPGKSFWDVYVNDHTLLPGNFSNEEGAKRVAWQFVLAKGKAIFSTYRFRLRAESC